MGIFAIFTQLDSFCQVVCSFSGMDYNRKDPSEASTAGWALFSLKFLYSTSVRLTCCQHAVFQQYKDLHIRYTVIPMQSLGRL